ncbi:MAG: hypothetical protein U0228_22420 [Myxococcaceae bacterium]
MRSATALAALVAAPAWACSGPGAEEAIVRATVLGWGCGLASLVLTSLIYFFTRGPATHRPKGAQLARRLAAVFVVIHPGWWISALSGDCGRSRTMFSIVAVVAHVGLLFVVTRLKPEPPAPAGPSAQ